MSGMKRTPRYFPAMKVRGARRRKIAPYQFMAGGFDRVGIAARDAALSFGGFIQAWRRGVR